MELKYGTDYPDSCPPSFAKPINGEYFRLCDCNPPTANDFKTHVDAKMSFPPAKLCEAKALSFFRNEKDANNVKNRFPKLKNKIPVAVNIVPNHGVGLEIHGHLNLWEFQGINLLNFIKEDHYETAEV